MRGTLGLSLQSCLESEDVLRAQGPQNVGSSAYEFPQGKSLHTTVFQMLQVATRVQGRSVCIKRTGEFEITAGETSESFSDFQN